METQNILDINDLYITILSLQNDVIESSKDYQDLSESFEDLFFPNYSPSELRQIERSLSDTPPSYVLDAHGYNFQFFPNFLDKLLKNNNYSKKFPHAIATFVMHSFLSWSLFFEKCNFIDTEYLPVLLNSLGHITSSSDYAEYIDKRLPVSAIYWCFQLVFTGIQQNGTVYYNFSQIVSILCKYITSFEEFVFPDFVKIMELIVTYFFQEDNEKTQSLTGVSAQIIRTVYDLSNKINDSTIIDLVDDAIGKIKYSVCCLDELALTLLSNASEETRKSFYHPVTESIINIVDNYDIFDESSINYGEISDVPHVEFNNKNNPFSVPKGNFDSVDQDLLHSKQKCMNIIKKDEKSAISPDLEIRLAFIAETFSLEKEIGEIFVNTYYENIVIMKDKKLYSQYYALLYVAKKISERQMILLSPNIVYNDIIFSPYFTVFNDNNDTNKAHVINILRNMSVDLMLISCRKYLEEILHESAFYPYQLAELVYRIFSCLPPIIDAFNIEKLGSGFFEPYLFYRNITAASADAAVAICIANENIRDLLIAICRDAKTISKFFDNHSFTRYYYSLFYEEKTQNDALSLLNFYLSKAEKVSMNFIKSTQEFIDSLFDTKISEFNWFSVALQVINAINSCVAVSITIAHQFTCITESLCKDLSKLPNITLEKNGKKYAAVDVLMEVVSFLGFTSHGHSIQIKELIAIEAAINRLTCNNPTTEIKEKLVHIIAGRPLSYILPNFEIKQPKVLGLFVRVFINSDKLTDVLNFLTQLCNGSVENCKKCHEGDFDIFLIELIDEWREYGNQKPEIVDKVLTLLTTMASFITSPIVVQRFISLMAPVDGVNLPYFHKNIIAALNSMLIKTMKVPGAFFNLDDKSSIKVYGLKDTDFGDAFTFAFWIQYIPQEKVFKQALFKVFDNDKHMFKISLTNSTITARVYDGDQSYSGTAEVPLIPKAWNQVVVTLKRVNDTPLGSNVTINVNGTMIKNISKFCSLVLKPGPVNVVINEISNKYKNVIASNIRLSTFSLFKSSLTENEINAACDVGPCSPFIHSSRIFYFEAQQSNGMFSMRANTIRDEISYSCNIKHVKADQTFAVVLVDVCNVENVIPLFAQLDLIDKNGKSFELLEDIAVDVVKNVLSLNEVAQISFSDVGGFKAIAHLLMNTKSEHLTYQLYTRLFGLLQIITIQKLIKELYDSLILNIDIWIRAPAKVHLRIIKHWARTVYQLEDKTPKEVRSFSWFAYALRYYYWYKSTENNIMKDRCNNEEINVDECRRYIYEIMSLYLDDNLKEEEMKSFITCASTSKEMLQANSFLGYIGEIAKHGGTPYLIRKAIFKNAGALIDLITNCTCTLVTLFEVFIAIFTSIDEARKNFAVFAFRILRKLTKECASREFQSYLTRKMSEGYTEFLPIALWVTINMENVREEEITDTIDTIRSDLHYNFGTFSLIYPVLILFVIKKRLNCIKFLTEKFSENWKEISFLINIFGRSLNMVDESQNIQSEFISEMFRYIKTHEELLTVDIFNIVFQFIFFRAVPQSGSVHFWNSVLEENYVNSLYCTDNLPGVTLYAKLSLLNSPAKLSEITESNEWQFYFGLRLGKDEEWADVNLVKEVIDVLTEKYSKLVVAENYGEHVGHILILLGYLARYDIGLVKFFFDKNPTVFTRDGLCFIRSNIKEHEFVPNIIPMQKLSKGEVATFAFRFINDEAEKAQNYSAKEKEFSNLITEKVSKLMTSSSNNDSNNEMEKIRSHLTIKQQEYERTWISMWRSMTLDRAPWNSALPPSSRKVVRFKRDNCICTSFCPYKLRRNFNFDDHKEASMIRDKGSKETVKKEMARQIKRHLSSVVDLPDFIIDESNESRPILSPSKAKQVEISDSKSELSIPCRIISMKKSTKAKIFLFYDKIVIKKVKNKTTKQIVFLKKDIDHIFYRPFQGKLTAIEIFAKGRKSYFINFEVPIASKVQQIYSILNIQPKPGHYFQTTDFMSFFKSTGLTEKWVNHEISTFDYLMYLNVFSGRSFNVASQYPVFPWVLCDYSSKEIDLTNPKIYRDLSKPVGALNDERLKELKKKRDENEEAGLDSYLYSSGYSFPLSVYLFLLRVEPFTSLHINMQGGKFDYSARLFNSIAEAYNLVCNQQSDFRELIPEFFFMPEFLLDMNEFDLGFVQGEKVNNVSLPQWANDCFDFIYMNRKALESEYVSKNIPDWIDLIWGYKQSGEAAKDADNVFRPELYSDIWEKEAELSEEEKKLISITLDQVGQIPHKLFNEAHPKRKETNRISNQEIKTLNCPSNIDGFSVSRESKRSLMFFVYDKRATKITRYDFELSRLNDNSPESKAAVVKLNNGIDVLAIGKTNKLIALERNCCVLLADDLLHVKKILIPSCDASIIESHVGIVTCAVDGPYTVLAGNDAALLIYSNNSVHPNIVRTYRNTITFIALSRTFDQVVAGTKDHSLIFCSLSRGSITCVVDLPKGVIANKILITKSMGFVLVDGVHPVNGSIQHVLYLYNINGNFIREIEINFDVACWCTYEDNSGFDFLFAADQDGNIYYYEVFFISNEIQPIYNCKKEVVSIYCFKDESTAVFSCRDGSIVLYPI